MIYFIMLFISLLLAGLYVKKEKKKIYAVLSFVPFFLVSALRYDVGTDYLYRYVPNYISIVNGMNVASLEPLFNLLIKVCVFFTKDYSLLFIITSAIIIGLIFKKIYKESKIVVLSIIIFFAGSFFFQSMNLVRQYISIAIIFSSYKLLLSDKKSDHIIWFFAIVVASLFHTISIAFLPMYFFRKRHISIKVFIVLLLFIIIFGGIIPELLVSFMKIVGLNEFTNFNKYEHYLLYKGELPYATLISELIIYIYMVIMYNNFKKKTNFNEEKTKANFYLNCQSFVLLFTIMNIHIELFFRFAAIFAIFQILSIPYFYYQNKIDGIKIVRIYIKKGAIYLTTLIVGIMFFRLIYSNIICRAEEVFPYKTIFIEERV